MARVVMVHGAGNALWGPASIHARWYPALTDGLAWHGRSLAAGDVRVAFYGDLFRPDPERGYVPPLDGVQAIAELSRVIQRSEPEVDLDELVKVLTEQHVDRLLSQAVAYLDDPSIRRTAQARVESAVGTDTCVLVAHSLGTLVAYEALCRHPDWPVTDLVTLGSPLGSDLIRDALGGDSDLAPWPGRIVAWTNVRGTDDPACLSGLAGRFDGPVVDRVVDNGHRVHDPEPYLNNPTTGQAVADGLAR